MSNIFISRVTLPQHEVGSLIAFLHRPHTLAKSPALCLLTTDKSVSMFGYYICGKRGTPSTRNSPYAVSIRPYRFSSQFSNGVFSVLRRRM
jgi:hypothetical protein